MGDMADYSMEDYVDCYDCYDRDERLVEEVNIKVSTVKAITDKAILAVTESGREVWLPISHIIDRNSHQKGWSGDLLITRWLAEKKGLRDG